jgi:hypothetical protein
MASLLKTLVISTLTTTLLYTATTTAQSPGDTEHYYPQTTKADWVVSYAETYKESSRPYDLFDLITAFGGDQIAIINQLGAPKQRYEWQTENRHKDGVMDTVVTLVYEGLTIELLELKHKTFVSRVFIENCELTSPFQNYLCKPLSEVVNQLGDPTVVQDDEVIYTLQHGDIGSNPMRLGTTEDKVTWIYINRLID